MTPPRIRAPIATVLIPVHNGAAYLRAAVESILKQSFGDFELLVVDDCSDDESAAIIQSYSDPRIRLVHSGERLRICGALNLGIGLARGVFVARMDADDISHPRRLAKQVAVMMRHPDVGLCGTWVRRFGAAGKPRVDRRPTDHERIRAFALFDNPLIHASVMFRRELLDKLHLRYEEEFRNAEDYDLWTRLLPHTRVANVPSPLLDYRVHPTSVTYAASSGMDAAACLVLRRLLTGIGMTPSADEVELHRRVGTGRLDVAAGRPAIAAAAAWLARIADNNRTCRTYPDPVLRAIVGGVWFRACYPMVHEGAWIVREYLAVHSAVCRGAGLTWVPVFVAAAIKASLRRLRGGGSPVHSPPGTKDDDMPVHG